MFRLSLATIPADWKVTVVVESKDANLPFPAGVEVVVNDFERQTDNINGKGAIKCIVNQLARLTVSKQRCLKIDSDTLLLHPDIFANPSTDIIGIANRRSAGSMMGMAYAVSQKAAAWAARYCFTRWSCPDGPYAEDFHITRWAQAGFGVKALRLEQHNMYWEWFDQMGPQGGIELHHLVANYGWRLGAFPDRTEAVVRMTKHFEANPALCRRPLAHNLDTSIK
jgi:hypothetical protein